MSWRAEFEDDCLYIADAENFASLELYIDGAIKTKGKDFFEEENEVENLDKAVLFFLNEIFRRYNLEIENLRSDSAEFRFEDKFVLRWREKQMKVSLKGATIEINFVERSVVVTYYEVFSYKFWGVLTDASKYKRLLYKNKIWLGVPVELVLFDKEVSGRAKGEIAFEFSENNVEWYARALFSDEVDGTGLAEWILNILEKVEKVGENTYKIGEVVIKFGKRGLKSLKYRKGAFKLDFNGLDFSILFDSKTKQGSLTGVLTIHQFMEINKKAKALGLI